MACQAFLSSFVSLYSKYLENRTVNSSIRRCHKSGVYSIITFLASFSLSIVSYGENPAPSPSVSAPTEQEELEGLKKSIELMRLFENDFKDEGPSLSPVVEKIDSQTLPYPIDEKLVASLKDRVQTQAFIQQRFSSPSLIWPWEGLPDWIGIKKVTVEHAQSPAGAVALISTALGESSRGLSELFSHSLELSLPVREEKTIITSLSGIAELELPALSTFTVNALTGTTHAGNTSVQDLIIEKCENDYCKVRYQVLPDVDVKFYPLNGKGERLSVSSSMSRSLDDPMGLKKLDPATITIENLRELKILREQYRSNRGPQNKSYSIHAQGVIKSLLVAVFLKPEIVAVPFNAACLPSAENDLVVGSGWTAKQQFCNKALYTSPPAKLEPIAAPKSEAEINLSLRKYLVESSSKNLQYEVVVPPELPALIRRQEATMRVDDFKAYAADGSIIDAYASIVDSPKSQDLILLDVSRAGGKDTVNTIHHVSGNMVISIFSSSTPLTVPIGGKDPTSSIEATADQIVVSISSPRTLQLKDYKYIHAQDAQGQYLKVIKGLIFGGDAPPGRNITRIAFGGIPATVEVQMLTGEKKYKIPFIAGQSSSLPVQQKVDPQTTVAPPQAAAKMDAQVALAFMVASTGPYVVANFTDGTPQALYYRLGENGKRTATEEAPYKDPRTGRYGASTVINLPKGMPSRPFALTLDWVDVRGNKHGPTTITVDPREESIHAAKSQLKGMLADRWVSFRLFSYNGQALAYFSTLLNYRKTFRSLQYSVDSTALDRSITFPRDENFMEVTSVMQTGDMVTISPESKYLYIKVTLIDGTTLGPKKIPIVFEAY
jgi:hypothetical protein